MIHPCFIMYLTKSHRYARGLAPLLLAFAVACGGGNGDGGHDGGGDSGDAATVGVCPTSASSPISPPPGGFPTCSPVNEGQDICAELGEGWHCTGQCWEAFWDGPCWPLDAGVDSGVDAGSFDPTTASCAELSAAFDQHVSGIGTACSTVSDCVAVGGTGSCDCMPSLGASASGVAVSSAALASYAQGDELAAIRAAFQSRCFMQSGECGANPGLCVCDAAPVALDCVNQHCVGTWASCLSFP